MKSKRTALLAIVAVSLMLPFAAFGLLISSSGATSVSLGNASSFAVLAASTVTNTGPTTITGNLGLYAGTSFTGSASVTFISGAPQITNTAAQNAQASLTTAISAAASQTPAGTNSGVVSANLGGQTLGPGVYSDAGHSPMAITGTLTLNGGGNPNAVFIFQASSTLTTASASKVVLTGSAQACNVFWEVASSATLGTNSAFNGTILAVASITLTTGATIQGAALASTGAVTMDTNTITVPTCATSTTTSTTATTTTHTIVPIISRICSTITPPPTPLVYLTVNTTTTSGSPVTGILILCNSQNGQLTSTVYSPARIGLDTATNHSIGVDDSGCYVFDHWSDTGSTNRFRTVSITSNTTYTAVFRNTCVATPAGYSTINVGTSIANGGNASLGLYATLWQNGNLLQSCYTTCTFTVPNGQSYQVIINNYGNYFFTKWSDGVLTSTHTVTLAAGSTNSNVVLTANIGFSLGLLSSQIWAVNEGLASGATCDVSVGGSPLYTNQSSALTIAQKIIVGTPDLACGTLMPVTYVQVLYQNVNSGGGWIVFWHNP